MFLLLACVHPDDDVRTRRPDDTDTWEPTTETDAAWAALSESVEAQIRDEDVAGFQVGVVLDGKLRYTGGFGVRAYGSEEPVTEDTVFRWASVSKMHTATAVLQLVEDGDIDLDAPVTDVLNVELADGFSADDITAWHLLTHTAALPDELDWQCRTGDNVLSNYVEDSEYALYAPPGSFFNYSNTGYVWAAAMMEAVTGERFVDRMREHVLEPAGMETATFDAEEAAAGEHADGIGYWNDSLFEYPLEEWDCGWSRPAGWLHGTARDLARTAEWQLADGGDLLEAASVEQMHAQVDTHWVPDGSFQVGYGQFSMNYKGLPMVWHDGWVTGFVSTWAIVPDAGFGVTVVSNTEWADPYAVMYDAVDLFLAPDGETPDYTTDPSTWGGYVGSYLDPYVYGRIEVTLDGDELLVEFVDLKYTVNLLQEAGDYFWLREPDGSWVDLRFIADDTGEYRWFVLRTGVGERVEAAATEPAGDPARARAMLARYGRPELPERGRLYHGGDG